jgi:flagellar basal-body rod protein FlgF
MQMENTSYVGLSYQLALQQKMDSIANNVANVDTTGYKSGHVTFQEHISRPSNAPPVSQVMDYGNYRNFSSGTLQQTGSPYDVALEGNGFLAVDDGTGNKYTRNGNFHKNSAGELVTSAGHIVLDAGDKPIIVPNDARDLTIDNKGVVSTDQGQIGQLKIVRFDDPQKLRPVGNSLFETEQSGTPDDQTVVIQGALEGSNVNAITEMTGMIEVMRKYQSVARLLQNDHDMQRSMIQQLSK